MDITLKEILGMDSVINRYTVATNFELLAAIKNVIKSFEGKVLNKRFVTALKKVNPDLDAEFDLYKFEITYCPMKAPAENVFGNLIAQAISIVRVHAKNYHQPEWLDASGERLTNVDILINDMQKTLESNLKFRLTLMEERDTLMLEKTKYNSVYRNYQDSRYQFSSYAAKLLNIQ